MSSSRSLQRQEYILNLLASDGSISAHEVAEKLRVSIWTVRRDLNEMAERGVLKRYYGGAEANIANLPCYLQERESLRQSSGVNLAAKERIGQATVKLLKRGEHIALGAGSTTMEVARALKKARFEAEIVTNALDIALEMAECPDIRVVCTGGDVQARYHTLVGSVTERMLKTHYFDVAVIGVSGITSRQGITVNSQVDAITLAIMMEHSCRVIIVADRSKFGRLCFASLVVNAPIHYLVTDEVPAPEYCDYLNAHKIQLVIPDEPL